MRAKQLRQGVFIGGMVMLACWLAVSIWGLSQKASVAVSEANQAKMRYQALEERKVMLEANLAALDTARGKDAAIRTAFGVARPGEEVIIVVPPAVVATATPQKTWWEELLSWF